MKEIEDIIAEQKAQQSSFQGAGVDQNAFRGFMADMRRALVGISELQTLEMQRMGQAIKKAITEIELPQPIVNVPAQKQHKPMDLAPLKKAIEKIEIPEVDLSPVAKAVNELGKKIDGFKQKDVDFSAVTEAVRGVEKAVRNIPVTYPSTQMDINPLRGVALTTRISVGTSATPLPASNLTNRRSIIIYNEDASATVRIGGSAVTASGAAQGIPIPPQSYSVPIDAGYSMTIYGIVASSSANVTVFETSNDAIGSA